MAEYRRVSSSGDMEPKNTARYIGDKPTPHKCTSCAKKDRFMWIKAQREDATDLECPVCDHTKTIPKGTENFP